ncbi:glutamate racemase [Parasediminibacterium sp. JCM 36343]|uniref:glutamate racemase n=1 Tax=Parasediminibacterium sp. JCM 36343 TaxID=3374279 RepID=UPI00397AECDA
MMLIAALFTVNAQEPAKPVDSSLPVGVFDSGTGGLTVLEAILKLDAYNNITGKPGADGKPDFENEKFEYLADQANMPYGNYAAAGKTDLLKEHVLKNLKFLIGSQYDKPAAPTWQIAAKRPVKMVVVACNTATAYALGDMKAYIQTYNPSIPCIGVIDAGSKAALQYQQTHKGTIGVFATAGTVASNGYQRTLKQMAAQYLGVGDLSIVSQGGVGLAESIDRDNDYFNDTLTKARSNYRGPSLKNTKLAIDTSLLPIYHFDKSYNKMLCEYDPKTNNCLEMQINDPANYVRYHLVTLLEKMRKENTALPLNTLILGCTHYPYMKDIIAKVLLELYNFKNGNAYRYRHLMAAHVQLIDPAVETAKEAYLAMRSHNLASATTVKAQNQFFICVPNTDLKEVQLENNGWFTYAYKYGRNVGENKTFVRTEPFSTKNIAPATFQRFKTALPHVHTLLTQQIVGL